MKTQLERRLAMRQHHAVKSGVSIGKEFTDSEKKIQIEKNSKESELRKKYCIDSDIRLVRRCTWYDEKVLVYDFEPLPKIYPAPITPIQIKFDGVDTVGNVFGKPERIYLPKKNIAL